MHSYKCFHTQSEAMPKKKLKIKNRTCKNALVDSHWHTAIVTRPMHIIMAGQHENS